MTLISMTGFADLTGGVGDVTWVWEARSVNGRSLDLRIGRLWHVSVAVAGWVGLVVLFALPLQVGR